jgi:surface polysaccharide O-acyltransferase-like enzyme
MFGKKEADPLKRRFDYDILRVISMLGVIYLHLASGSLRNLDCTSVWNFSNLVTACATPAVPLFFMMSGALLLNAEKTADLRALFRQRIPKVLVPLCVWSAVNLCYTAYEGDPAGALETLRHLLNTPACVPYWFLYALIPMYLLSPLLKKMADGLTQAHWNYMMGLWVVCTLGLYTLRSFVPEAWKLTFTEHWSLNVNVVSGYLGYFLLGTYLERLERLPSKKLLAAVVAAMIAVSTVGTRWDTYAHGAYSDRFTNYLSLFTFVLSAAIFLLAKSCLRGKEEKGRLLPLLSGVSFCVYLIHPLVIDRAGRLWWRLTSLADPVHIWQQLVLYLCVSLCCILAAVVLASIKPLCYLFTGQTFSSACQTSNIFTLFSRKKQEQPR